MDKKPFKECPSFIVCSCNNCPLDPDAPAGGGKLHESLPDEQKCRAHKPTRAKIGAKYADILPYQGLTIREFQGRQRWNALSATQKEFAVEQASKRLKTQSARGMGAL